MTDPFDDPFVTPHVPAEPVAPVAPVVHLPRIPAEPAPEITSRFLFVDVASMRAKQLRSGALARIDYSTARAEGRPAPHKLERMAIEEVKQRLVEYDLPPDPTTQKS
jgi:DNA-directed RNA polymerase subunit K/omega